MEKQNCRSAALLSNLNAAISKLTRALCSAAGVVLVAMTVMIMANITGRFLGHPLAGTYELLGFLLLFIVGAPLAALGIEGKHVYVSIFTDRLPKRAAITISVFIDTLVVLFLAIVTWRVLNFGTHTRVMGEVTETLGIAVYPMVYLLAFFFLLFFVALLLQFARTTANLVKKRNHRR